MERSTLVIEVKEYAIAQGWINETVRAEQRGDVYFYHGSAAFEYGGFWWLLLAVQHDPPITGSVHRLDGIGVLLQEPLTDTDRPSLGDYLQQLKGS
jgi:hypothetical protein